MIKLKSLIKRVLRYKFFSEIEYYIYLLLNITIMFFSPKYFIKDSLTTLKDIRENQKSIARFGDGEMLLISGVGINFQEFNQKISMRLQEILTSNEPEIFIGIPRAFGMLKGFKKSSKKFWSKEMLVKRKYWRTYLSSTKVYYDAFITRPYMNYTDRKMSESIFEEMRSIWDNKELIIVEGAESRIGVGNDLFNNCASIQRIICPSVNAFAKYAEILKTAASVPKEKLILIALGPTATVLAYDLSRCGYWAIDIGHLDIEYEWYKKGATSKGKVKGKYVNEVSNGNIVEDITDETYNNQIIHKIY